MVRSHPLSVELILVFYRDYTKTIAAVKARDVVAPSAWEFPLPWIDPATTFSSLALRPCHIGKSFPSDPGPIPGLFLTHWDSISLQTVPAGKGARESFSTSDSRRRRCGIFADRSPHTEARPRVIAVFR